MDGTSDVSITQPGFTYARYSKGVQFSRLITEGSLHIAAKYPGKSYILLHLLISYYLLHNLLYITGPVDKLQTLTYPFSQVVWVMLSLSVVLVAAFLLVNKHLLETK